MKKKAKSLSLIILASVLSVVTILVALTFSVGAAVAGVITTGTFGLTEILLAGGILFTVAAVFMQQRFKRRVREKLYWYESLLDAIPFPISVTDKDMNWTFINKPVEDMLKIKRNEVLGKQCENWNANICRTENCGIARLKSGQLQTQFKQLGMEFQVDTSYIFDAKGNKVGHIEVVQDITSKVRGAQYNNEEVTKLANNLKALSEGRLNLEFSVSEGDKYTEENKRNFEEINKNFKAAVNSISGYIEETISVLSVIDEGDFSRALETDFKGDFSALKTVINNIITSLNNMVTEVKGAAERVASGTRQVSDGSQSISQGATEQASSIEELTASIAQIAQQTKQNAMSANKANELTVEAVSDAAKGNDQMKSMQQAMTEISESSQNISKIIKVIDDIAFQTNILALNAAVEAARAGVHGKGFAVVAEEVRNLAARSANAAKETTDLIEGSIRKTEAGTKIADDTAQALSNIVEGVDKAAQLVSEIARASNEQASAIAQVNSGIEQMSLVVQTNSATAEEEAAASQELSSQAEILQNMVDKFRLRESVNEQRNYVLASKKEVYSESDLKETVIKISDSDFGKY